MNENYNQSIGLKCLTCGDNNFTFNDDKSWVKCNRCNREYQGGYNEIVELNQPEINSEIQEMKNVFINNAKIELNKIMKNTFKGNKNIKSK
jgi:hypothetical protein